MSPRLYMLAGGNGAGKSTFFRNRLEPAGTAFVSADRIAVELDPARPAAASLEAARIAMARVARLIEERRSFAYESVFSHPSKVELLAAARRANYEIVLVYIHLEDDALNRARVAQRVLQGGHAVSDERIVSRLPRTLANVTSAVVLADHVLLLDNSSAANPFELVAESRLGTVTLHVDPLPGWARNVLAL